MNHTDIVQKIILAGVVLNDGKVLILQRSKHEDSYPNIWELPGGKREPLESSEDSLIREIKEESGLDVKVILPISVFDYQIQKPQEISDSTQINFLVIPIKNTDVTISREHQAFAWIELKELESHDMTGATKDAIKQAFKVSSVADSWIV